jgi:crotonobetainyl-CoA:carnitine CoA-transferase CaiB-like acyl-CoA transferase
MIDGEAMAAAKAAPRLGEHTQEVLGALGVTAEEIAGLRAKGVVG